MVLTGKQLIGQEQATSDNKTFYGSNPATGETLQPAFYEGTPGDVDQAVQLAERDFDAYRQMPLEKRAVFLETIADEIMALGDDLIERAASETGLPEGRFRGERGRTVGQLRLFADVVRKGNWAGLRIDRAQPERQPLPRADIRLRHIPLGPVAVFGASNFPLAFSVAGGDSASALAAGCPIVVKGHPAHPGTSELVGRAIQSAVKKCGMPEGTFSLINGSGFEVGVALVKHPLIKAVAFTGSLRGGKAIFDMAAARPEPIPVYAEMGSTNPVFILPGKLKQDREALATGLAGSVTLGVGQFCTNPGLVLSQSGDDLSDFIDKTRNALAEKAPATMLHAGIKKAYVSGLDQLQGIDGVELISDRRYQSAEGCLGGPALLKTSAATFLKNDRLEEEVFGPSSMIVACDSRDEMLAAARKLKGHLTATILGTEEELSEYQDLISILERKVGRIVFNGFPTGVEVCDAMNHGGPYPATTDSRTTSVGTLAIDRFLRPVCYQGFPEAVLPAELRNQNSDGNMRMIDGQISREDA